jgi:MFS family permease
LLAWSVRIPAITAGNDDAVYLLLARSLRSGNYVDLFYVGLPTHSQYPPIYPGFLALLGSIFGEQLSIFLAANILLSTVALALFFSVARRRDPKIALFALGVCAVNPMLLAMAGALRSEPLCMALTALALWLADRPVVSTRFRLGSAASAIGAALTRSASVTLVAALALLWVLRRQWRALVALSVAAALTVGPWLVWTVVAPHKVAGRSYIADATLLTPAPQPPDSGVVTPEPTPPPEAQQVTAPSPPGLGSALIGRVKQNLPAYAVVSLGILALPSVAGTRLDNVLWLIVIVSFGAVGLWGMWRWWTGACLALLCQGALLAFWPYVLERYLVPVLPLAIIALSFGASRIGTLFPRLKGGVVLPAALAAASLAGAAPLVGGMKTRASECRSTIAEQRSRCGSPEERAFFEAAAFIASSTPETARFLAAKEGAFYYYAHRQVVPIYAVLGGDVKDILAYLAENEAEYVFLSHLKVDEWVIVRPLEGICSDLDLVHSWGPTTLLLRVHKSAGSKAACEAIHAYAQAPWGNRLFRAVDPR